MVRQRAAAERSAGAVPREGRKTGGGRERCRCQKKMSAEGNEIHSLGMFLVCFNSLLGSSSIDS